MPDDPQKQNSDLSVLDAVRLKHWLHEGITWGNSNLNAIQVEQLVRLTADDYQRIREEYRKWNRNVIGTVSLVLLTLGSAVCVAIAPYFLLKVLALAIGISAFYHLARRKGHSEGYIDGYDAGHDEGIHKVLGIKPEQLREMHEIATEMKIDNALIKGMEERRATTKEQ